MRKWRRLRKLLEVLSEDILEMGLFWRTNSVDFEMDPIWPTLKMREEFVESIYFHCDMSESVLSPSANEGVVEDVFWTFALLMDTCEARGLVSRMHPEEDFRVKDAFVGDCFVGWEVRFFQTFSEVEKFVKEHPEYSKYSLYFDYRKLPFKYAYNNGERKVYCDRLDFMQHEDSFIEVSDLVELTVEGEVQYCMFEDEESLAYQARKMVKSFECSDWDKQCSVRIRARNQVYNARLVIPQNCPDLSFLIEDDKEG